MFGDWKDLSVEGGEGKGESGDGGRSGDGSAEEGTTVFDDPCEYKLSPSPSPLLSSSLCPSVGPPMLTGRIGDSSL